MIFLSWSSIRYNLGPYIFEYKSFSIRRSHRYLFSEKVMARIEVYVR